MSLIKKVGRKIIYRLIKKVTIDYEDLHKKV